MGWCHFSMPIQMMTKCGKMAWQTSQEWRPMVSVHSWGSKLLAVASKGWTAVSIAQRCWITRLDPAELGSV